MDPTPAHGPRRALERWISALELAGAGLLLLELVMFAVRVHLLQGDLRTYQIAARAALAGADPYVPGTLAALAGRTTTPFVYPPVGLAPLLPFAALPYHTVAACWMVSNVLLLAGMVALWRALFPAARLLPLALCALLGWNAAALWAVRSGNVVILECALVWAALACFVHGRRTLFAALVVGAACFKLAPAAFLLLLLVPAGGHRGSPRRLLVAAGALALLVLGPMLAGPLSGWTPFWRHLPHAEGLGASNPSVLAFAFVTLGSLGLDDAAALRGATVAWAAFGLLLIAASAPVLRAAWRARDARRWALLSVFLFVLLEPRPMAYGYLLLVPAPLLLAAGAHASPRRQLLLAAVLAVEGFATLTQHGSGAPIVTYAPCLLSLCMWALVVQEATAPPALRHDAAPTAFEPAERAA